MARSDDLRPLFLPDESSGVGYRKGVVLTWNQTTLKNTIEVAGATLTDMPVLLTPEASLLEPGDSVAILTVGSSWFVLGRIVNP